MEEGLSLGLVVGLIKGIATKIAIQYESIGITSVESTPTALVFHFTPPIADSVVPYTYIMAKAIYDTNNDGIVDHADTADKLNGQLPSYYLNSHNCTFDNANTDITATIVDAVLKELDIKINSLAQETQTNNDGIHDIIKGDFLTSLGNISLTKSDSGVIINSNAIDNNINALETTMSNLNTEVKAHYISSTAHNGIFERIANKGIPNGYVPLESNGKIADTFLPFVPPTLTSYLLTENSTITDAAINTFYKQRCTSKTDSRYSSTTQSSSFTISVTQNTYT